MRDYNKYEMMFLSPTGGWVMVMVVENKQKVYEQVYQPIILFWIDL